MNNANLIKVSENQVKAILKNKNKSQYFDVYDTEHNFKIGRLKISENSYLDSMGKKKYQEMINLNMDWMLGDDLYRASIIIQYVFNLRKPYDLDTFNMSMDVYINDIAAQSQSTSINKNKLGKYHMLSFKEGKKTECIYENNKNYQLHDHFAEETVMLFYKNKRIGEEFKYNGLKADDTLTETTDFKYVDTIFDKNKNELHVYEIDLLSSSDDDAMFDKLRVTCDNKNSIKEFKCGQFEAKAKRQHLYKRAMN